MRTEKRDCLGHWMRAWGHNCREPRCGHRYIVITIMIRTVALQMSFNQGKIDMLCIMVPCITTTDEQVGMEPIRKEKYTGNLS